MSIMINGLLIHFLYVTIVFVCLFFQSLESSIAGLKIS